MSAKLARCRRFARWSRLMPQVQLPIFAAGITPITSQLGYVKQDGRVTYFNGMMPVFAHDADDLKTFRMITSQFCVNGNCSQPDIVRAFGVPLTTVKRYCALYREKGVCGFYEERAVRGAGVLIPSVLENAQLLLDQDIAPSQVAGKLGIKPNTLIKAIRAGRLHERAKKKIFPV